MRVRALLLFLLVWASPALVDALLLECYREQLGSLTTQELNALYRGFRRWIPAFSPLESVLVPYVESECGTTVALLQATGGLDSPLTDWTHSVKVTGEEALRTYRQLRRNLGKYMLEPADNPYGVRFHGPLLRWDERDGSELPNSVESLSRVSVRAAVEQIGRVRCLLGVHESERHCLELLRPTQRDPLVGDRLLITMLLPTLDHTLMLERDGDEYAIYQTSVFGYNLRNYLLQEPRREYPFPPLNEPPAPGSLLGGGRALSAVEMRRWLDDLLELVLLVDRGETKGEAVTRYFERLFWVKPRSYLRKFQRAGPHVVFSYGPPASIDACVHALEVLKRLTNVASLSKAVDSTSQSS